MKPQQWETVNSIVDDAMDLGEVEREKFINERCGDDQELKREVTELLSCIEDSAAESFLEHPKDTFKDLKDDISSRRRKADSVLIGEKIDKYKIIKLIEHGGMGSVFLALRTDGAYKKRVALKILRRGMDTPSNVARFKRERNILANLNHPNITRLLDGGVTKDGLPFLVMEYIQGTPLFTYCDENRLSIEKRLKLFKTICKALRHAHKNAVIHRDLKPSNILITDDGSVKVLDFGIAKIVEGEHSPTTGFQTRSGERMLTLRYGAPEQVSSQPITTTTDIYTLGILFYELLAGVHPFNFKTKDVNKIEKLIREEFPEKPSARFQRLAKNKKEEIARKRNTNVSALKKQLSDELEAIVLKSLRKEPEARYHSVDQLVDDIKRRERNQPVSAKENTLQYRISTFLRRRKKEVSIALLLIFIVNVFVIFHTRQITKERNIAQQEARRADQVSSFLLNLFETQSAEDTLSAAGLLQKGMIHLQEMEDKPAQADMFSVMGQAYMNFGNYEKAENLLQKAINESRNIYGHQSLQYAEALFRMGLLYQQRYEWRQAVSYFQQSYELHAKILGNEHVKTGNILTHFGTSLRNIGEYEKAERYVRKAVDIQKDVIEPTNKQMIKTYANLAYVLHERGKMDESESIYLEVIERAKDNPSVEEEVLGDYYNNFGYFYRVNNEYSKAVENYKNALSHLNQGLVNGHPKIIRTRKNLATTLFFQDSLNQTEALFKKNLSEIREKYSPTHKRTATALNTLGLFYLETEDFRDAELYLRKSLDVHRDVLGTDHLWTAYTEGLLTASLKFQNKQSAEVNSLHAHHLKVYREHQNEFDSINRNQVNRLVRIYKKYKKKDSAYVAYQQFLN